MSNWFSDAWNSVARFFGYKKSKLAIEEGEFNGKLPILLTAGDDGRLSDGYMDSEPAVRAEETPTSIDRATLSGVLDISADAPPERASGMTEDEEAAGVMQSVLDAPAEEEPLNLEPVEAGEVAFAEAACEAGEASVTDEAILPPLEAVTSETDAQSVLMLVMADDATSTTMADAFASETTLVIPAAAATPFDLADDRPAPVEMKPEPVAKPSVSFTQLYDLIATEVGKRTDSAVGVYERLLQANREELDTTRKNNRLAWSVGGVMTAIAAFGGIWSAGEVSSAKVELTGLRQQVASNTGIAAERDQLKDQLIKASDATTKVEAIKARLDQALAVSAERDRLRGELDSTRKAKAEVEGELRAARTVIATATTQPISMAKPVSDSRTAGATLLGTKTLEKQGESAAVGSERTDVWSVLLNGQE